MVTVEEIIKKAGGAGEIAALIPSISPHAPRKWPVIGIPERHWPTIMSLTGVTAHELFAANRKARTVREKAAKEAK